MRRFAYKKLVRDNILEVLKNDGATATFRILSQEDFVLELKKKLIEEVHEVSEVQDRTELLAELADVLEVIEGLAKISEFSSEEIATARQKKNEKRGAFLRGIYIDHIDAPENSYVADYCAKHPEKYPELISETIKI